MTLNEKINSLLPDPDNYLIGFADMKNMLTERYKDFNYCIAIGKKLDDKIIDSIISGPTREYLKLYRDTNKELNYSAEKISTLLASMNAESLVVPPTIGEANLTGEIEKTLDYGFSHKKTGTRSGLGWIGKTDLFISEQFGPRIRLASVLTNYPLPLEKDPVERSMCGACDLCVTVCPAQAANGALWDINVNREDFFDPYKCRDKCRELSLKNIGKDITICGMCISVCPYGRNQQQGRGLTA
jgi:epoxyqueuosine reductase